MEHPGSMSIRCNLPTERGDESTDIVVFSMNGEIVNILATTAPNSVILSLPRTYSPQILTAWPESISCNAAKDVVLWVTKWVKDIHMKSKCVLGPDMERVRELILSMASVAFMHPSAIYSSNTEIATAKLKNFEETAGKLRASLESELPPNDPPADPRDMIGLIQTRRCAIMVWSYPLPSDTDAIRVPFPALKGRTMNSTVVFLGDLVHKDAETLYTYNTSIGADIKPDCLLNVDTSRATITYLPESDEHIMPFGIHYPTPRFRDISDGRAVLLADGTVGEDKTALGLVQFTSYHGMCVPLICGCAIVDRVRFERAHIPLVFLPDRRDHIEFSDYYRDSAQLVILNVNSKVMGVMDISKKEKHGSLWWVILNPL